MAESECLERSKTTKGSSNDLSGVHGTGCLNPAVDESSADLEASCNMLYLPYCDGASFLADKPPIEVNGSTLWFRGRVNLEQTIIHALDHSGLKEATDVVVAGMSAGALGALLHADRVKAILKEQASHPAKLRVSALVISGFFLTGPVHPVYKEEPRHPFRLTDLQRTHGLGDFCSDAADCGNPIPVLQRAVRVPVRFARRAGWGPARGASFALLHLHFLTPITLRLS